MTRSARRSQGLLLLLHQGDRPLAGDRLDAAHAGGDAGLLHDLEQADVAGGLDMGAAAQLHADFADRTTRTRVAVLFAEQGGGAAPHRLGQFHLAGIDRRRWPWMKRLTSCSTRRISSAVMAEKWVKSKRRRSGVDQRAGLLDVVAEHLA